MCTIPKLEQQRYFYDYENAWTLPMVTQLADVAESAHLKNVTQVLSEMQPL